MLTYLLVFKLNSNVDVFQLQNTFENRVCLIYVSKNRLTANGGRDIRMLSYLAPGVISPNLVPRS